jgi:hypothetical protein
MQHAMRGWVHSARWPSTLVQFSGGSPPALNLVKFS